jgi:hypothetical protein
MRALPDATFTQEGPPVDTICAFTMLLLPFYLSACLFMFLFASLFPL